MTEEELQAITTLIQFRQGDEPLSITAMRLWADSQALDELRKKLREIPPRHKKSELEILTDHADYDD